MENQPNTPRLERDTTRVVHHPDGTRELQLHFHESITGPNYLPNAVGEAAPPLRTGPVPTAAVTALCTGRFSVGDFDRLLDDLGAIHPLYLTNRIHGKGLAVYPAAYWAAVKLHCMAPVTNAVWAAAIQERYAVTLSVALTKYNPGGTGRNVFNDQFKEAKRLLNSYGFL